MILKKWEDLPESMRNDAVRKYYDILSQKKSAILLKRIFDVFVSFIMLIFLSPLLLVLCIAVKLDSKGPAFFLQTRVTSYGKRFKIVKFRTMVVNAEQIGTQVTTGNDSRITKTGNFLRKTRLDEISQLINIIKGDMSFVGTRPEVVKYVEHYTDEMMATLLLPAGVTSQASIKYKDESKLLEDAKNADETYVNEVLPQKMKYNLESLEDFGFWKDIKTMFETVFAVLKR